MKRAKHLLQHALRALAGLLAAHLICCGLETFTLLPEQIIGKPEKIGLHLSLISGCIVAWMAGHAVRIRPRETSYFVQPVSYGERLGIQILVLLGGILLPVVLIKWIATTRLDQIDSAWGSLRFALHLGAKDFLMIMVFFVTGVLGFYWLRASLIVALSYWLGYSCLLEWGLGNMDHHALILRWGLFCGLGLVAFLVYKSRHNLTELQLSIVCVLTILMCALGISYADHLSLERQVSEALAKTFNRHPVENAFTLKASRTLGASSQKSPIVSLALTGLQRKSGLDALVLQKITWCWRHGANERWRPEPKGTFTPRPTEVSSILELQNSKSEPIDIKGGQVKFSINIPLIVGEEHPRRAIRSVEFVIDDVTIAMAGVASPIGADLTKADPISSKLKRRLWSQGALLQLAELDHSRPPTNMIELTSFVQRHSVEKIAPLVGQWLPEMMQMLEMNLHVPILQTAIAQGATEAQKAEIIAKVPEIPALVSVLIARGWTKEAKREILACSERDYAPLGLMLPMMIESGDPDYFPLILRAMDSMHAHLSLDLSKMPALLREYIIKQRPEHFTEDRGIWYALSKLGDRDAAIVCLSNDPFSLALPLLRDPNLRPIEYNMKMINEIQRNPDRLVFHPQLKTFIYTPPSAP